MLHNENVDIQRVSDINFLT